MNAFVNPLTGRQIVALTATIVLVAAPHALRLPWWLGLISLALIVWRLYLARAGFALPHRRAIAALVLATSAAIVLHYGTLWGRDAGVALLVTMVALKLLEAVTRRDAMLIAFLCFFLAGTGFLYSQSIATALYMTFSVWVIVAGLIDLQHARGVAGTPRALKLAGVMLAQSVPLMLVLFVLFPRVQGPLWGSAVETQRNVTGLSETMSPGSLSGIVLSDAVAFRASFKSGIPDLASLYWRGPVLTDYDGTTWRAGPLGLKAPSPETTARPVEYTVTVEPHGKPWLFAIDLPGAAPPHSIITHDMQLLSSQPVSARVRYDMVSFVDGTYGQDERATVLQRALRLPADLNPKTAALARQLRERHAENRALLHAVIAMFRQEGFVYTVSPPLLGRHGIDEFLFDTKSGFCEHYASAFTVLMRAAGIPARVVTGYLGGELNPIGEYLIVRQADAHAWAEVWLEREGWVRVDPTAAVAPARTVQGSSAAFEMTGAFALFRGDLPLLRHLRFAWDTLATGWNDRVLGYTFDRQRALLTQSGFDGANWRTLVAALFVAATLVVLALALTTLQRLRVRVRDPLQFAHAAFCRKLARAGLPRERHEGPFDYAERVSRARPDLEIPVRRFLALYADARYASQPDAAAIQALQTLARAFTPHPHPTPPHKYIAPQGA
jgi:transglutaminase-like putative cysteine protease